MQVLVAVRQVVVGLDHGVQTAGGDFLDLRVAILAGELLQGGELLQVGRQVAQAGQGALPLLTLGRRLPGHHVA